MTAAQIRGLCSSTAQTIQEYRTSSLSKGSLVDSNNYCIENGLVSLVNTHFLVATLVPMPLLQAQGKLHRLILNYTHDLLANL